MKTWQIAIVLGVGSLIFFFLGITNPTERVLDEYKYIDPAKGILAGTYDNCPDGPPLGKLILASSIALIGDNPLGWRTPSAICGALTLVAIFLLTRLLLNDLALALTAAAITLLNNFLYVFSRNAMMDIFLVVFAVWSVLAFTAALKMEGLGRKKRRLLLAASGILVGLAIACKWNGVDELCVFLALGVGLLFLPDRWKSPEFLRCSANLREAGIPVFALSMFVLPASMYVLAYLPYCLLLHLPISPRQFVALNVYIWRFHLAIAGNPTIMVPWYKWPLRTEPMRMLSYLIGNWYVMWVGLMALLFCLRRFFRNLPETLILMLYLANFLQWAVTPQSCLFYYYYFPAAMFLGVAIPIALSRLPVRVYGMRLTVATVLPAFCVFAFCFARMAHLPTPFDCMLGCWP